VSLQATVRLRRGTLHLDAEIEVGDGEVLALCGPNGAGKTTLLRALAGLETLAEGRVVLDGRVLEDASPGQRTLVLPQQRRIGVVFQEPLLFPHLTVLDNVAFGPRSQGTARVAATRVAETWLGRLGLRELALARPAALSGGQARRVALARALAAAPRLLLLDEPLTALDAPSQSEVRQALRRDHSSPPVARVLVTHNPIDALTLASRIAVLEAGRIVQSGSVTEVSRRPRTPFTAELLGVNLYRGWIAPGGLKLANGHFVAGVAGAEAPASGEGVAVVHPRAVALHRRAPQGSPRNVFAGRVASVDRLTDRVRVRLAGAVPIVAEITPAAAVELRLFEGMTLWAAVKAQEVDVFGV
jgi:molybdate transport system ATP-binding protein